MLLGLEKRLVLVTGGTQGIGFGIAEMFVQEGAHVILNARNAANLDSARDKINANAYSGKVVAGMVKSPNDLLFGQEYTHEDDNWMTMTDTKTMSSYM